MPEFSVRVLLQCAEPGVTPDVDNAMATLPRRMLCELPRELAPLLAASAGPQVVDGPGTPSDLALQAVRKVLAVDGRFDVLPEAWSHREVAGSYLRSNGEATVFVLARAGGKRPWYIRQAALVANATTGETREIPYEFRCHLLVERLGASDAEADASGDS